MDDIAHLLARAPVIPVLTVERAADAAPLARALVAGGLPVLEVTLRTPVALEAIAAMNGVEGAVVGAGTVLNGGEVEAAFGAGAAFMVSPGLIAAVVERARDVGAPILPGAATASDLMRGLEMGLTHFKFFPAEHAGGVGMLKAWSGPFAACRFCPTGGVTAQSAPAYLALANVACVGGTWIAPAELVRAGDWAEITARAAIAAGLRDSSAG
ncbi:MAG: bifunctional 4-hydroxy-2-oxoglutarate aldolase/2-dehydro-3-deoxy-phosphogluconate aldolase [Hyphomonadaceae bacterium]|nr:bifunctional 4-hydroxy-2-oxoglutarate aldolase/2-dehydro-3-deoxy-phosphogluconate aldolase [Hyphomonadaceae bacterium]